MQVSFFLPANDAAPYQPGTSHFSLAPILSHPVSRGTVHIQSNNPLEAPAIDPAILREPVDIDVLVEGLRLTRKIANTHPLASMTTRQDHPAAELTSDAELKEYIRANAALNQHPVGTAAMVPKEDGGVVDSKLKVYGTANVRVVSDDWDLIS